MDQELGRAQFNAQVKGGGFVETFFAWTTHNPLGFKGALLLLAFAVSLALTTMWADVFKSFDEKPVAKKCQGTIGLLKEGEEVIASFKDSVALNAALISALQKVEHYEIASYGCLHEWATDLGNDTAANMLEEILEEENEANKSLIEVARSRSNKEALAKGTPNDCSCDSKQGNRAASASL